MAVVGHLMLGLALLVMPNDGAAAVGGAPVINLALVPLVQFDGTGASQENQPAASGGGSGSAPKEVKRIPVAKPAQTDPVSALADPLPSIEAALLSTPEVSTPSPDSASGKNRSADDQNGDQSGSQSDGESGASTNGLTSGGGARTLGGAAAAGEDTYAATVIAWVERHKGRPRASTRGDVVVRFVLDRRGRLREIDIIGSSGARALDRLAIEALEAAQPFPLPPSGSDWRTREFRVRLQYKPRDESASAAGSSN